MKNSDIPYKNLSKDYSRLYDLLKAGKKIVAFCAILLKNEYNKDYSRIEILSYDAEYRKFDLWGAMFEMDFKKEDIIFEMEKMDIRYFDAE